MLDNLKNVVFLFAPIKLKWCFIYQRLTCVEAQGAVPLGMKLGSLAAFTEKNQKLFLAVFSHRPPQ